VTEHLAGWTHFVEKKWAGGQELAEKSAEHSRVNRSWPPDGLPGQRSDGRVTDALVVPGVTAGWNRGLMRLEPQSDFLPV